MRRSTLILLSGTVLLIVSLACGTPSIPVTGPSVPSMDANALGTAIMATMVSAATQTARAASPTPTATQSFTPAPPTLTPTETLSPTPPFTSTPIVPLISVSMDTNCRTGPGQIYDRTGALLVGETTEVFARDPTAKYWYVQNPDKEEEFCWVWGKYATIAGNVLALPMYTPPPTPTPAPNFDASYSGLETCSGWWVDIQLTNTGGSNFKSVAITIKDMSTDVNISLYADQFKVIDDCVDSTTKDILYPGGTFTVSVPAFSYDPSGHKLRATVKLCSDIGQNGACVTQVVKFSP